MPTRRWVLLLLLAMTLVVVAGCGGGTTNVQNPPPPPQSKLSVAFQPAPATSLLINATTDLTAVVSEDPGNYGVDWSVTCHSVGNCGTLSSSHSDSGQTVTYYPPQTLLGNSEPVNIVAFATADHTKNAVAPMTVLAFGSILKGVYVIQVNGNDGTYPYNLTGVVSLDGNGNIGSGQQTLDFLDPQTAAYTSLTTPIAGGSYFVGPDGRGTITISTTDNTGTQVTEQYGLVVLFSSQALVADMSNQTFSTGTLDRQASTTAPTGGYAFALNGADTTPSPLAIGGVLNVDNIATGANSLVDQVYDPSQSHTQTLVSCKPKGSVSQPDVNGVVTVDLTLTGKNCIGSVQLAGYIVDDMHVKLIETDSNSNFSLSGIAIGQGSATGSFDLASFNGTYVWGVLGVETTDNPPPLSSLTSVGTVTADGTGNIQNGFTDTLMLAGLNPDGTTSPAQISAPMIDGTDGGSTYQVDGYGVGRVITTFKYQTKTSFNNRYIFYLTANRGLALVLDAGGNDKHDPAMGVGIAYPQTPPPSLSGPYGFSFTLASSGGQAEVIGQMTADVTKGPPLFGAADYSASVGSMSLSGSYGDPDSYGRMQGTLDLSGNNPLSTAMVYYPVDSDHGFFVESDLVNPGSGQVALGYFARRVQVCDACQ